MSNPTPVDFAKALSDPTRQKIMQLCCCQWISVNDIVAQTNVAQPTVSHHLAMLREAGLVHVREEGRQTFYMLDQDKVINCCGRIMAVFAPGKSLPIVIKLSKAE